MESEEFIVVRCTTPDPNDLGRPNVWYQLTTDRKDIDKLILAARTYSDEAVIEVLECTVKHCTKADVKIFW